jgi:gamma-glutamyltranspeptidase/glutathione hydrolase
LDGSEHFSPKNNAVYNTQFEEDFTAGTTSVEAADEEGWVISMTPSGDGFLHALRVIQVLV